MRLTPPIARDKIARNLDGSLRITDRFAPSRHYGVDYSCLEGTPIYAARDGVAYRGSQPSGFGLYVRLEDGNGLYVYTAHLRNWAVADGARVKAGDVIGYSGNTGNSTGPHLHFEIRKGSRLQASAVDPEPLIDWPGESRGMLTTLHVQRYAAWQNAFAKEVSAQWIKIVNPPENVALFPDVPNVLVRIWTDPTDAGYIAEGREGGHRFVRDMLPHWRKVQVRGPVYELWNEPECNSNVGLAKLREATIGAIEEANAQGVTLCILNIAEGNPHDNGTRNEGVVAWKWNELAPAIKAAVRGGHYLGRHCYWRPEVEGPTGRYHALGRLKADLDMLRDIGVDVSRLKVLVNETGIDGGIAGHTSQQGWRDLSNEAEYGGQVVEAERFARTMAQVHALMLFTAGYEQPWDGFEHDVAFCGSLIQPLLALDGGPAIPEIPPADTTPTPSEPLPNDEQGTPAVLAQKARWWCEEMQRQFEAGKLERAQAIRLSLIALLTRLEGALA